MLADLDDERRRKRLGLCTAIAGGLTLAVFSGSTALRLHWGELELSSGFFKGFVVIWGLATAGLAATLAKRFPAEMRSPFHDEGMWREPDDAVRAEWQAQRWDDTLEAVGVRRPDRSERADPT